MTTGMTLGLVATWFVLGQARIVFGSKMVEHRTDGVDASEAIAFTRAAAAARRDAANYDARGRRLLPWYLAVTRAYWFLVASIGCWALADALGRV
jgi:hypothetical protein